MKNIDGTIYAQKAISAVLRTNMQLTLTSLNEVLRGVQSKAVVDGGFNRIKTFGAGADLSATQWRYYLIQMIVKGVFSIDYDNKFYLIVTEYGHKILDGSENLELIEVDMERTKHPGCIVFHKKEFEIDPEIRDCINWTECLKKLSETLYWNRREEKLLSSYDVIPERVENRAAVLSRFLHIAKASLFIKTVGNNIVLPVYRLRDNDGNVVELPTGSFDEILSKFRLFIIQNNRYPIIKSSAEEASLRRWYQEVGHGIIEITEEQRLLFNNLAVEYQHVPRITPTEK